MDIIELLLQAKAQRASDLHLAVNRQPMLRIDGCITPVEDMPRLTEADMEEALTRLTTEEERKCFNKCLELDFGRTIQGILRVRGNAARQRGTISLSMRLIPMVIPAFEDLHLPEVCKYLITRPRGMVIISGLTGSGKSTTLAAMINHLNNNCRYSRVITIEDPVNYIFLLINHFAILWREK